MLHDDDNVLFLMCLSMKSVYNVTKQIHSNYSESVVKILIYLNISINEYAVKVKVTKIVDYF